MSSSGAIFELPLLYPETLAVIMSSQAFKIPTAAAVFQQLSGLFMIGVPKAHKYGCTMSAWLRPSSITSRAADRGFVRRSAASTATRSQQYIWQAIFRMSPFWAPPGPQLSSTRSYGRDCPPITRNS